MSRGFTLFEMLIVMAIVAILTGIAIPSYRYVTTSNRIASEINGALGDFQFARSEAIKEGQSVTMCVSTNGATCSANNTNWHQGWIVFSDPNGNGDVNTGEMPMRVQSPFSGTDTLTSSNGVAFVTFNRVGYTSTSVGFGNATRLTLHASPASAGSTRCVSFYNLGQMIVTSYDGYWCT